jgi:hypothetical protein
VVEGKAPGQSWDTDIALVGPATAATSGVGIETLARRLPTDLILADSDAVIVLSADHRVVPNVDLEPLAKSPLTKAPAVAAAPGSGGQFTIDTTHPYEEVALEAKRRIWQMLSADR